MLGKQGWRFMTNPDSLVSGVYKVKYFRDGNYLNAKLGASPRFTWRSLWEAREVVSAGVCWRIGSEESVEISGQPWLTDMDNPYVTTVSDSFQNNKVKALMRIDNKVWDHEVITDLFNLRDQKCILGL
ncbi:putative mitochondrial protein AtMg00310 [Apium graveolens]|uniref:putative mitochondrial protein AtMg00310 n=1 Tax=Apium graveolens TaxID=4045 RepID=UPI003D7BA36A